MNFLFALILFTGFTPQQNNLLVPINLPDRQSINNLRLTRIGQFGLMRKPRAGIPAHFHTGIDIQRPSENYHNEPIFPVGKGVVISLRTDGPYAQLIIEHTSAPQIFWSVYEHITGIKVSVGDTANPWIPFARFMNKKELDTYGWQFDHVHFEVLKMRPQKIKPNPNNPNRLFRSYSLECFTPATLERYFYNPLHFL